VQRNELKKDEEQERGGTVKKRKDSRLKTVRRHNIESRKITIDYHDDDGTSEARTRQTIAGEIMNQFSIQTLIE
jgi:hypothetical protein